MPAQDSGSHQLPMLSLAGEVFALDARLVREILDPVYVTAVPGGRCGEDFVIVLSLERWLATEGFLLAQSAEAA